jgi:membrane protein
MERKFSFKLIWKALKDSFKGFSDDKVTKLSASLAYYTVFSLGPLLILVIYLCSVFLGKEAVEGQVVQQLQGFIGAGAAKQIQTIIQNAAIDGSGFASTVGIVTLLIGATTVFAEMQDSMNSIWGIKAKPKSGIMKLVMSRVLSFGMIASLGFLLLVSLAVSTVVESIGNKLKNVFPDVGVFIIYAVNLALTLVVITTLFAVIFKVLPDVKLKWRHAVPGAIATALLFLIGKFAISFYISKSDVGSSYGAAGSMIVLILWIYYSSIILYFGAEFTQAYAAAKGTVIIPDENAVWNNKPAIAGASPAKQKLNEWSGKSQKGPNQKHLTEHKFHVSEQQKAHKKQTEKKSAGVGTMLLGLTLYMLNHSSHRANR